MKFCNGTDSWRKSFIIVNSSEDEMNLYLNMDFREESCNNEEFCASTFVTNLIEKGTEISCDETNSQFERIPRLPAYYDPEKFKRGQELFHKHIFAMLFTKILGLVSILAIPDIAHILRSTQMSDEPLTAYRRYLSTVFHMCIWYKDDFHPESKLWKSINKVKFKHNSASRRSCTLSKAFISQKSMALTQFGFMGFAVWKTEQVGIHGAKKEDLEAFVHIWRVIGYLMGIEERFNICRESVEETREICNELAVRILKPEVEKKHDHFLKLSYALLTGMWCMTPFLQYETYIYLADRFLTPTSNNNNNNNKLKYMKPANFHLNPFQKLYVQIIYFVLFMLKFTICRVLEQWLMYLTIWLMEHCPFLAYYVFGKANSHVRIL